MAWTRISLEDLRNRIVNDLSNRLGLNTPVLKTSVVYIFGTVYAAAVYTQHLFLEWVQNQFFAKTCDDSELDRLGAEVGLYRKAARYATCDCTFTGPIDTIISTGTRFKAASTGYTYYTVDDYTIAPATSVVAVSDIPGAAYTIDPTDTFTLISPIPSVDNDLATCTVRAVGADLETSDAFRGRISQRKEETPQGGAYGDYIKWASSISPVTDVYPFGQYPDANNVTVVVANYTNTPPVILDVSEIQAYLDSERPVTASVIVESVEALDTALWITINSTSQDLKDAIQKNIEELFYLTPPLTTITIEELGYAIQNVPFVFTSSLTGVFSAGNLESIVLGYKSVAVLDTITWNEVV